MIYLLNSLSLLKANRTNLSFTDKSNNWQLIKDIEIS